MVDSEKLEKAWETRRSRVRQAKRRRTPQRLFEFLDAQVAELDAFAVALQPDVAGGAREAGVFLGDRWVFTAVVEVGINEFLAVQDDNDPTPLSPDDHG